MSLVRGRTMPATAAIILVGRKVLLGKRGKNWKYGGYWEIPGGSVGFSETFRAGCKREISEELGLDIPLRKFEFSSVVEVKWPKDRVHIIFAIFEAKLRNLPKLVLTAHTEVRLFDFGKLPLRLTPATKKALENIKRGNRF